MSKGAAIFAFVCLLSHSLFSQEIWTIGPMLHFNFGGEKRTTSFAIEAAYWNIKHFPYSIDAAIEFDRGKIRWYSELQTGIGIAGLSAGPVFELNTMNGSAHLGFQSTFWANYILGADFRMRWIDHHRYNCVGIYAKVPMAYNGIDKSHHHHHSSGIWDWDD